MLELRTGDNIQVTTYRQFHGEREIPEVFFAKFEERVTAEYATVTRVIDGEKHSVHARIDEISC